MGVEYILYIYTTLCVYIQQSTVYKYRFALVEYIYVICVCIYTHICIDVCIYFFVPQQQPTPEGLLRMFSPFGALHHTGVKLFRNQKGECNGIGFVNYLEAGDAQAACTALNGFSDKDGTAIWVTTKACANIYIYIYMYRGSGLGQTLYIGCVRVLPWSFWWFSLF